MDWTGCNADGANLRGVNLSGANLKNADLGYADLTGATLSHAQFNGTFFTGANFTGATIIQAEFNFDNEPGRDCKFLIRPRPVGQLRRAANLSGSAIEGQFRDANFTYGNL